MLSFSGSLKILVAVEPCDMRKGFNGLYAAVTERLGEDPKGGALYVFCNRRHNRLKILYWDGTGFCIWYKRLERGSFQRPAAVAGEEQPDLELSMAQLSLMLQGIDLTSVRQRLRFHRLPAETAGMQGDQY